MEQISLYIKNAHVYNSYLKQFVEADVSVADGKFLFVDRRDRTETETFGPDPEQADRILDADGLYMIPGLVDIHMHIESSMMTPGPFGRCLAGHGVTTIVAEPHEMANVRGMRGILEMIRTGEESPIDIYYGIPSSVPSTNETMETTGGIIGLKEMKQLLEEKDVVCVGEIMNYRQIIRENDLEITKFLAYLRQERPGFVIEGHCPSLVGHELAAFLALGIDGDHTEHTLEEVRQRIENGMFMEIQEKTLQPDILEYICRNRLFEYCSFVTDDTMADVLYREGQLNKVVEKAVRKGFPVEEAIYCATYTPSRRMHLYDRGVIAPGKTADFMLLKDLNVWEPERVYKNGMEIFRRGDRMTEYTKDRFPEDFYHSVQIRNLCEDDFRMPVSRFLPETACPESVTVRAIEVLPDRTQTRETRVEMRVRNGRIDWKESGCLLAMVLERHGKNGGIGYGFITGACLKKGAAATTYFHDHHNLFVAGSDEEDMKAAVDRILKMQGGFVTAENGKILAELPLPVCGILSEGTVEEVGTGLSRVRESLCRLGYDHVNTIMSFGTLGLPVSPALKITDKGLIDVKASAVVSLITDWR